ncbi:MAG TPA: NAD-dependent epimerase/dehydratase family protein, partial [Acidimicrobiia bacterium]|nr:NAD-dependent epimerase/dehydratase family protein [Acidimicrobiia bacterium]
LEDPLRTHLVNATGTLTVLEAVRSRPTTHLIVASSSSVYGRTRRLPQSEDLAPAPASPYAASKLAAEGYARAHAAAFGLDVLVLRPFNVFGRFQPAGHAYAAVIPAFVAAALDGRPLTVHGDGRQSRDFTHVDFVVAVLVDALRRRVTGGGPVNLACGGRTSLLEVAGIIDRTLRTRSTLNHVDARPGDIRDSQADTTRLRELFPHLTPVSLEEGLRETVEWFQGEVASARGA